ncbi:unknown [Coprococcus eutactus CAG:665]|nr:unknown [Coprococcus eutactus CAG:665]
MYQELAGKRFWAELTGDEEFYIKIIGYMGTMPENTLLIIKKVIIGQQIDWLESSLTVSAGMMVALTGKSL